MNIDNDKFNYRTNEHIVTNILVLDSKHRNVTMYPKANNFTINLDNIRDVLAIKLIKFDIYGSGHSLDISSIYLQINDYKQAFIGTDNIKSAFANFIATTNGLSYHDTSSVYIETDPNTYVFNPVAGNLYKFDISILKSDGSLFDTLDYSVVINLAVYTKRNKFSRN